MIKNVLPFFLDGGIQEISGGDFWNGTSSFVESTTDAGLVVDVKSPSGRPVKPGTLLAVTNRGGSLVTVSPLADFSDNDDTIAINDYGDSVLLMFKGPSATNKLGEWVVLSKFQADTTNSLEEYSTTQEVMGLIGDAFSASSITFPGDLTFQGLEKVAIPAAVTATGTAQGDAATLTVESRVLEVSGTGTDGVVFPQVADGTVVTLINSGSGNVKVYPAGTNTINGGAQSAAHVLAAGAAATLIFKGTNAYLV